MVGEAAAEYPLMDHLTEGRTQALALVEKEDLPGAVELMLAHMADNEQTAWIAEREAAAGRLAASSQNREDVANWIEGVWLYALPVAERAEHYMPDRLSDPEHDTVVPDGVA